jgi:hypothetical protein
VEAAFQAQPGDLLVLAGRPIKPTWALSELRLEMDPAPRPARAADFGPVGESVPRANSAGKKPLLRQRALHLLKARVCGPARQPWKPSVEVRANATTW